MESERKAKELELQKLREEEQTRKQKAEMEARRKLEEIERLRLEEEDRRAALALQDQLQKEALEDSKYRQQLEQERRDHELALRLANESNGQVEESPPLMRKYVKGIKASEGSDWIWGNVEIIFVLLNEDHHFPQISNSFVKRKLTFIFKRRTFKEFHLDFKVQAVHIFHPHRSQMQFICHFGFSKIHDSKFSR